MEFVIIITYLLILTLIHFKVKDTVSRRLSLTYVSYWVISLLLCYVNPFDYFKVSDSTYWLLLGHLVAFMIGFVLFKARNSINEINVSNFSVNKVTKNKLFIILFIICFVFVLVLFYRQRMLVALYTLGELRGDFMSMILADSGFAYLFYEIVGTGMFHFTLCLLSYMLLFERKWFWICILFVYDVIWAVVTGGRAQVMTLGFYFLSMYIIADYIQSIKNGTKSKYTFSTKAKLMISLFVIGLVLSLSIVSFMKQSTGDVDEEALVEGMSRLGMDIGEYSAGPIVAFDQGMKDSEIIPKKYQYGAATFCGTDYFLYIAFRRFGIHEKTSYDETTHVFQEALMKIAPDRGWNYAYTSCMYYYHDFGVLGVILISFLFGIITRRLISRLYVSADIYNIAFFTFVCFCLYMSVFSGYTHKMMVFFYVALLLVMSCYTQFRRKKLNQKLK